jgi:hypothetical protein
MIMELEEILSQRIKKHCLPHFNDSHYKHAAHEAMIQVEQALKEKGRVKDKRFGTTLISSLFKFDGIEKNIKLQKSNYSICSNFSQAIIYLRKMQMDLEKNCGKWE